MLCHCPRRCNPVFCPTYNRTVSHSFHPTACETVQSRHCTLLAGRHEVLDAPTSRLGRLVVAADLPERRRQRRVNLEFLGVVGDYVGSAGAAHCRLLRLVGDIVARLLLGLGGITLVTHLEQAVVRIGAKRPGTAIALISTECEQVDGCLLLVTQW